MKCGICQQSLSHLKEICSCQEDPYAGLELAEGRYRLLGRIAEGGMGIVYRALRLEDDFLCVIKISRWNEALQQLRSFEPEEAKKEEESRVGREFDLLQKASSQTPHIVQVYDKMREDPQIGLYYPMEFLEGQPLSELPEWGAPLAKNQVVELVLQMCEGIGIAHGLGVVHRDLNPDNMFIVRHKKHEQFVKLIDFGIARDLYAKRGVFGTGHDMAFGHLHYLAPEQVGYSPITGTYERETASKLDTRADLYTIGAIMFHMLTGYPPFEDDTLEGLALRDWDEPANLKRAKKEGKLPRGLRDIVCSCLEVSPDQRPPDIYVLTDMLQSYRDNPLVGPPPPPSKQQNPFGGTDSAELWSAVNEGMVPGELGALDQFSQEFDSVFDESDIAEVTFETTNISSAPIETGGYMPPGVLEALENAPAFLEDEDGFSMFESHEQLTAHSGTKSITVKDADDAHHRPSSRSLPEHSPQLEELLKKQSEQKLKKSENKGKNPIESLIAEALFEAPVTKEPLPPLVPSRKTNRTIVSLFVITFGIILLGISVYFIFT